MSGAQCRDCGPRIRGVNATNDRWMPLDAEPIDDGRVVIRGGEAVVLSDASREAALEVSETIWRAHFASCTRKRQHPKPKPSVPTGATELRQAFEKSRQWGYRMGCEEGCGAGRHERGRQPTRNGSLDRKLLTRLIALVHPDPRPPERSGELNTITAELNLLRKRPT
jgi:hypothetical protein